MIQHQPQGWNECQLATLAMLGNVPLAQLRGTVERRYGKTWVELVHSTLPDTFWEVVHQLWDELGLGPLDFTCCPTCVLRTGTLATPDLTGRGMLIIRWNEEPGGHAMAFEHGRIYDPNAPHGNGETWAEWLDTLPHRYIRTVRDWAVTPARDPHPNKTEE